MRKDQQQLEAWLYHTIGLEMFKGGFERAKTTLDPYKKIFQERQLKIITIAGTNGKGQTAFECERHLHSLGLQTALWTSPHILHVTERFRFNTQEIEAKVLLDLAQNLHGQGHRDLSYYEFLFLCFCEAARLRDELDVLILEVGMGGLLDAVNVFDADIVGLTSISFDHTQILGSTLEQICAQKWGVTREGRVVVSALEQKELRQLTYTWAQSQSIELIEIPFEEYPHYVERNQAVASKIVARLYEQDHLFSSLLERAKWQPLKSPGRFEEMTLGKLRFIFIGAHNSDGYQKMIQLLEQKSQEGLFIDTVLFSFSTRPPMELEALVAQVKESKFLASQWWFCCFNHPKAITKSELRGESIVDLFSSLQARVCAEVDEAIEQLQLGSSQTVLVTGSYYFIGEVQKCISSAHPDHLVGDSQPRS